MTIPHKHNVPKAFACSLFGEHLILWAIRLWVTDYKNSNKNHEKLIHGMKLAGVIDAFEAFQELMTILSTSTKRQLEINCLDHPLTSIDEHILIDAVSAWMGPSCPQHYQLLNIDILPAAAARCAEISLGVIGVTFKNAGHLIRRRYLISTTPSKSTEKLNFSTKH